MESEPGTDPSKTLRIVIVLDSWIVPAWTAAVLQAVEQEFVVQAVLVPDDVRQPAGRDFLFARYQAWDRRRPQAGPDPLAPTAVKDKGPVIPEPDLVLWLSDAFPNSRFKPAKYGVWFFSHGRNRHGDPAAAYFPELIQLAAVSSTYLLALPPDRDPPLKVAQAHTASELGWSLARQQVAPLWKASLLPLWALRRLQEQGEAPADEGADKWSDKDGDTLANPAITATNANMIRFAARNLVRTVTRRLRYADMEAHWFVAYRTDPSQFMTRRHNFTEERGSQAVLGSSRAAIAEPPRRALPAFTAEGWTVLDAPPGHFYADPFVLTWSGRTFLYVEDYLYAERRGVLSVLEMDANGRFGPAEQILNRPYHLSYPFVFEHEGEVYLIPETMAARRIELYRAVQMPGRWELVKVLQDGIDAVDTTLWIDQGTFYFFTNLARAGVGPNELLYLFTASSLIGDWRPHPANPIGMDVRASRGAGKLFRTGSKLVRPSQDCSVRYGYGTQLNHVEVLTPHRFRERPLLRIEPDWASNLIGTHTINSDSVVEVIDGQVYRARYRQAAKASGSLGIASESD